MEMETKMKEGFFTRLLRKFLVRTFISYVVLIALVFTLIYLFTQNTIQDFYIKNAKTQLNQVGHALIPKAKDLFRAGDTGAIDELTKSVGQKINVRITIIVPDGSVIADSKASPDQMENHRDRPEILHALKGDEKDASAIRFSTTVGEQMLYLALPVGNESGVQFVIRLSFFLSHIKQLTRELGWQFTVVLLLLFPLVLLIAWYFSRGISQPVRDIALATRDFAAGNFNAKIFLKKKDELAEVAESFNYMVGEQKKMFDSLSQNQSQLQAIISSMKEGLLVLDPWGKITLCNESFQEIADKKDLLDNSYWEVLRIPDFEKYVKEAFYSDESSYEEIHFNNKTFLVSFNRTKQGERLVVMFRDITDAKQLEQMKKDFVVNLTHELKTPLTAIKGFVETLEEEENIENISYIEIIKRHTDRMNQIVSDMLILSELEEKNGREIIFEPIDFSGMVSNILKIYRERIETKKLEIEVDIPEDLPVFKGEKFKMEQLFINLLDNAVKYTDSGKIAVTVSGDDKQEALTIRVSNTGLPIPESSLDRLFERFYVVDKSRSRKLGGTGLGLSIVKHVVLLHKGEIAVENAEDDGTVFTIKLPLK